MCFKIVKTVENGTVQLCIVPTAWEKDGCLYWPTKSCKEADKLIKDPESIPHIDWQKLPCTVKKADIESLKTAKKLCFLYSTLPDTEAEIEYFRTQKQTKKIVRARFTNETNQTNYNDDFDIIESETNQTGTIAADTSQQNNAQNNYYVNPFDAEYLETDITNGNGLEAKLETLNKKMNNLNIKLDFFIKINAETKVLLDEVLQTIKKQNEKVTTDNDETECTDRTEFNFPLRTTEEVDVLEKKLDNKVLQHQIFTKFQNIGGTSGKQDGEKVGLRLIKELFSTFLLCQYTWKGISTSRNTDSRPVIVFSKYERIINVLFKLMEKADSSTTKVSTEKFLQLKIFKRNTQRLKREINNKRKTSSTDNESTTENMDLNINQMAIKNLNQSTSQMETETLDSHTSAIHTSLLTEIDKAI